MDLKVEWIEGTWWVVDYARIRGSNAPTVVDGPHARKIDAQAKVAEINQRGFYAPKEES